MECAIKLCLIHILFIFVPFCLPQNKSIGQIPYRHFTSKDGLAGSNVLAFHQDKKGFIWFATSTGLSRFDGHEFVNYSTADGLLSNNLTGITTNSGDSLFISTYNSGINVLYNDLFSVYKINKVHTPLIHHMVGNSNRLFIYGDYFSEIYNNNLQRILGYGFIKNEFVKNHIQINNALAICDTNVLIFSSSGVYQLINNNLSKIKLNTVDEYSITSSFKLSDTTILMGGLDKIWNYDIKTKKYKLQYNFNQRNNSIQNILVDDFSNIWISFTNRGLYLLRDSTLVNLGNLLGLNKSQINFIQKDIEGNIWIGTFGQGVYCFYNLALTIFTPKDGLQNNYVLSINADPDNRIVIGTFNGLNIYDNNKLENLSTGFKGDYHYIRGIQKGEDNKMYIFGSFEDKNNGIYKISTNKYGNITYRIFNIAAALVKDENYYMWGGWDGDIGTGKLSGAIRTENSINNIFNDPEQNVRINKIVIDYLGNYWIGSTGGLCRIENNKTIYFRNHIILTKEINDIKQDRNNVIWIATSEGIVSFKNNSWTDYSNLFGKNISINAIAFDNGNGIWLGSNHGLILLKNNKIVDYSEKLGLLNNEINALYYDKKENILWIGTNQGLSKLDIRIFNKYKEIVPSTYITMINADDSVYNKNSQIIFPSTTKKIHLKFTSINFSEPKSIIYEYKFDREGEKWSSTRIPEIQFASLQQGSYNLLIRSKLSSGKWDIPINFTFTITTPFYKNYYFYSLILLLLISFIYLVAKSLISLKQKKEMIKKEAEHQVILLKQQALAAMMNPHFVFNSLNSIQNFINSHNLNEANSYLTNFAKLIRLNLNISEYSEITLEEELRRLSLYLSLEKKRFGDDFNFFIKTTSRVNTEKIKIPNMIIQPFVENSIRHGILPNGNKGNLDISIDINNSNELLIIIEDDGVGFDKSLNVKKSGHISKGIKIIENRLELISSKKYNKRKLIQIEKIESNFRTGTRVTILLPEDLFSKID